MSHEEGGPLNLLRQRREAVPNPPAIPLRYEVVVAGCHGGAGTSTLARLLGGAYDMGVCVPNPKGRPAVLVTRGTPDGAHRATTVVNQALDHGLHPHALVVVGDGPWPEPTAARARLRMLDGLVGGVVRLPYIPRWRYLDDPLSTPLPKAVVQALHQIHALVTSELVPAVGGTR